MPRPRRYDAAVRERLLKDAAMIAATEGPLALSARRLATQSGTTTAAIYTLFGGMDSLRAALTAQALQDLGSSLEAVAKDGNPADRLLALARAYRTWALEHPNEYRSILSDALGLAVRRAPAGAPRAAAAAPTVPITAPDVFLDSVDEAWHVSLAPLSEAFEAGLADGTFSGPASDAAALAVTVWASLHGIVSLELVGVLDPTLARLGGDAGADRFFEDALGRLIAGLVVPAPSRGAHA
ncbi:TetR/AcrR family transcriptional regulator [Galactobacter valiniphilus]|uniref:TetR/AcrR family transcriptional regulator n=1 Tax=Galactobacter valiniphilus TaxID=2676122 RepID=UPI00373541F0